MKFIDIKLKFNNNDILDIRNIINIFGPLDRRRLYEWQKKNYIKKITNNYYIFSETEIDESILQTAANRIYSPSYVGLESALSFYGFIPETVFQITSITTKKTKRLNTAIANFSYKYIHKRLFWGYIIKKINEHTFFISDPEKTILDYLYYNPQLINTLDFTELRLNKREIKKVLKPEKIKKYLTIFAKNKLTESANRLMGVLNVRL